MKTLGRAIPAVTCRRGIQLMGGGFSCLTLAPAFDDPPDAGPTTSGRTGRTGRRRSAAGRVAVMLLGSTLDEASVAEAGLLARSRGADLLGMQVLPGLLRGPLIEAGLDPEHLERGESIATRRRLRSQLSAAGFDRAPVVTLGRPRARVAIETAIECGCSALVLPSLRRFRLRSTASAASRHGLDLLVAPSRSPLSIASPSPSHH